MPQPTPFGRYLLERRLAVGDRAEVLLARLSGPERFQKRIVIKRMHAHLMAYPDAVEQFTREARLAAAINHPNVIQMYELAKVEGRLCMIMEFLRGIHLGRVLEEARARSAKVPDNVAAYIIASACHGVHFAHEVQLPSGTPMRIVHRDLTPGNIVVTWHGEIKVLDFGIAKHEGAPQTRSGIVKGNPHYFSPEQARGEALDCRSNIFTLGLVLLEMLSLKTTSASSTSDGTVEQRAGLRNVPREVDAVEIPPMLRAALRRMLEPDARRRVATAALAATALEDFLDSDRRPLPSEVADYLRDLTERTVAQFDATEIMLDTDLVPVSEELSDPKIAIAPAHLEAMLPGKRGPVVGLDDPTDPDIAETERVEVGPTRERARAQRVKSGTSWSLIEAITELEPSNRGLAWPWGIAAFTTLLALFTSISMVIREPQPAPSAQGGAAVGNARYGTILLRGKPADAVVSIAGLVARARLPVELERVPPGVYVVSFEAPGYHSAAHTLKVEAGRVGELEARLLPSSKGRLIVRVPSDTEVFLSDQRVAVGLLEGIELNPGTYPLVLVDSEGARRVLEAVVRRGETTVIR